MANKMQRTGAQAVEKKVSFKAARSAAIAAGYDLMDVKAIDAVGQLGKYFEQDTIKTLAPAILIRTMQELKKGIDDADKLLALPMEEVDVELRERILQRKISLIGQQIANAKALQEAAVLIGKTAPQPKFLNPSFAPREQVVPQKPVTVNIGIQSNGQVKVDGAA